MKEKVSISFLLLAITFCVCLIAANLLGIKIIQIGNFAVSAGLLVFPISYIINDCLTEVWGFKKARIVIFTAFLMNIFIVLIGLIVVYIPSSPFWNGNEHFAYVFNIAPRTTIGSLLAFLSGSLLNAFVMNKMKTLNNGKYFSFRAIVSTIVGEGVDSVIFFPIAFLGIIGFQELLMMILAQVILKTLYEILILPITIRSVKKLKQIEGI